MTCNYCFHSSADCAQAPLRDTVLILEGWSRVHRQLSISRSEGGLGPSQGPLVISHTRMTMIALIFQEAKRMPAEAKGQLSFSPLIQGQREPKGANGSWSQYSLTD